MRYACDILIKYSEKIFLFSIEEALNVLGFKPSTFDIFYAEFGDKGTFNIKYDIESIKKKLITEDVGSITIRENKMASSNSSWFRITINKKIRETIGNSFLMEWSINNNNLDFLLKSTFFKTILKSQELIYGYCYNQTDVAEQSNTHFNKFDDNIPKGIKLIINRYGDKEIDISKNWGKTIRIYNMLFVAAPYMWFGLGFDVIFPLEKLRKFRYITEITETYVHIKLFDLYENPINYRKKQKLFWEFINKNRIIQNYEKENK